jgi:hypothetical protein
MFRKVAPWYAKRFGPVNEFTRHVVQVSSKADFETVLQDYLVWRRQFLDENGELKPKFRPAPLVSSFMDDAPGPHTSHIPVPRGPVEVW